ncbi:MAG: hypothetical protein J6X34_02890 [Clostridia bacterium]|nr:hypothetical protein [Clostridia bacterium]MBP5780165.1 hypothetical protein [Clostridia bacterium]
MKKFKIITVLLLALALVLPLAVVSTATESEPEYEEKKIEFTFTGEEGLTLEESEIADTFIMQVVRAAGGEAQVEDDGTVTLKSYSGFYTDIDMAYDYFAGAYTFSIDYQFVTTNPALGGIFVRMTDPSAYTITNPKNAGTQQHFDMYEWDWYGENGGKEKGVSSIGGSGIRVYENKSAKKIGVSVKTRVEDGLYVHAQGVEFDYPEGFDATGRNNYKFVDDGKSSVQIFVNGGLLATVEYSGEKGTYPDGDEGDSDLVFYKKAVIKDASGTQLLELDNARISADYGAVGLGNRGDASTSFDNIVLTYLQEKKPATPVPTEAPATEAPTQKPTDEATAKPADTTKEPAAATPESGEKQTKSGNNLTWLYVVCGVVAVAAVGIIIAFSVKGKKKNK